MQLRVREQEAAPVAAIRMREGASLARRKVALKSYRHSRSYYDYPMLKPPHWKWEIYLYFFLSGIASAAYVASAIARLTDARRHEPVVRAGRYLSLPLLGVSTLLLIKDLGRPERFHHMMRIYKTRSPMSVGTWALGAMSLFSGLSAAQQLVDDGLLKRQSVAGRVFSVLSSRTIEVLGAFAGFFVAGYTGALLSATASPLWGRARALVTPIFISSAMSTALAAISLVLSIAGRTGEEVENRLKRADSLALLIELGLLAMLHQVLGPFSRFLMQGRSGLLYLLGVIGGVVAPLLMQMRPGFFGQRVSRSTSAIASSLTLAGGLLLRYLFLTSGKASTVDQEAEIEYGRVGRN